MISTVRGIVQQISAGEMVVEVGGVGLRVLVPRSVVESVASVGNVVFLYPHLVVRESDEVRLTVPDHLLELLQDIFRTALPLPAGPDRVTRAERATEGTPSGAEDGGNSPAVNLVAAPEVPLLFHDPAVGKGDAIQVLDHRPAHDFLPVPCDNVEERFFAFANDDGVNARVLDHVGRQCRGMEATEHHVIVRGFHLPG